MLKLRDTVELMSSSDYKERFIAEYAQSKIRYELLKDFNTRIEAAGRTAAMDVPYEKPKHDCPASLLREQQAAMGEYLHLLEVRAKIENVDLSDLENLVRKLTQDRIKLTQDRIEHIALAQKDGTTLFANAGTLAGAVQ